MDKAQKGIFLILLFTVLSHAGFSQKFMPTYRRPTAKEERIAERNHKCVHRNKYSTEQRLKFYPFNKAVQIKLVSFDDSTAFVSRLPLINDTVDYSKLRETIALTKKQTAQLTDILYNFGDRAPNTIVYGAACYNPHNAILFVDKCGHTFAYFEICFECMGYRLSSNRMKMGQFCEEKFALINNYFGQVGIKTGITPNMKMTVF
ncbi:MAG: hypothetical protein NVSMB24_08660 [Mucilaginibacter sp.]